MKNKLYIIATLLIVGGINLTLNAQSMFDAVKVQVDSNKLDFNSIDLAKIVDKTKDFSMSLSDSSIAAIKKAAEEKLSHLPNEALGINILELKDNIINADIAAKINQVIQNAYNTTQNIKPFVKDPKTGLMLIQTLYTVMAAQIPQSIKDLFVSILALSKKIVDSQDAKDIAALDALRKIVIANAGIIETLYNNRNNLPALKTISAGGVAFIPEVENFKSLVINVAPSGAPKLNDDLEAIKGLIERNGKELQEIFAKARAISAADLANFRQTFQTGLATAKSLLS